MKKVMEEIADLFAVVEQVDIRVSDVVMEKSLWEALLQDDYSRQLCDPEHLVANVKKGHAGLLWGAHVWIKDGFPAKCVKVYGERSAEFRAEHPEFDQGGLT